MKSIQEIREGFLQQNRWDDPNILAAIKYRGKIYTGKAHGFIINDMIEKHGISPLDMDSHLESENFGFTYKGVFFNDDGSLDYYHIKRFLGRGGKHD